MKLKKITVTGYKSVKIPQVLLVEDRVTVLIGANDHGKTNLLDAINLLNDDESLAVDDRNWDLSDSDDVVVEWHFAPSTDASERLASLGYSRPAEGEAPAPNLLPKNDDGYVIFRRNLKNGGIKVVGVPIEIEESKAPEILKLRPRIEIFSAPTTNLKDQVNRGELDTPEFEFMQGIFRLAGIWEQRGEIFVQNEKTSKLLDEASKQLTAVLNSKWNQGRDLEWKLEHTGTNGDHITIFIKDPAIGSRYTRPSLRSSGFRTYFLLSMITYARTENSKADSYIYLFDEPGTYLHPYAQLDLQRSFEAISARTQIIYTTHSLFLVSKNHPDRNRVISKGKDGTKIDQKPFVKNWKAVRDSLGILLSNNFLIAEKTLLVEGPSDVIYILHAIKRLKATQEVDIDLNDLSIVDAGTSENYIAMAKLMLSEGREIVALLDGDAGGETTGKQLEKICEKEIKAKKLQILKLPKGSSVEDVFADLNVLRQAIEEVTKELVDRGIRKIKAGLSAADEVAKIAAEKDATLGRVIDRETKRWFEPEEKLSKLSIALKYEDLLTESVSIPDDAKDEVAKLKAKLALKNESNEDKKIFEEV